MDYERILGEQINEPMNSASPLTIDRRTANDLGSEYYRPRLGIPEGFVPWEKNRTDILKILERFNSKGYEAGTPKDINEELRRHVEYFRNILDIYDHIIEYKVFCKDEIYYRCLAEGSSFTKFIKKCRAYSLQDKIALDNNPLDSKYIIEEYDGYDSIIHERYLINWDDSEETVDWPYSLVEPKEINEIKFQEAVTLLMEEMKMSEYEFPDIINVFEPAAKKVTSLAHNNKTTLLKNEWKPIYDYDKNWFATRRVVATSTGSTRDTGVPDVATLCKLKLIHLHARNLSEKCKYSANCNFKLFNQRIKRLRKSKYFLHIDFKKFGLTFNRRLPNILLDRINKSHLNITDFFLEVEDEIYKTHRGGVLGWFDPLVALCIIAILLHIKETYKWKDMDMMVFNDDVEIGFGNMPIQTLQARKAIILRELEEFDFLMSYRKIFISKESIFLEQYHGFVEETEAVGIKISTWGLKMVKTQLVAKYYGKSLSSPFSWEAKLYHAMGHKYVRSKWITNICQDTIKQVFVDEYEKPLELGGWTFDIRNGLNYALADATHEDLAFYIRLSKYRQPHLMPKMRAVDFDKVWNTRNNRIAEETLHSLRPSLASRIELEEKHIFDEIIEAIENLESSSEEEQEEYNPSDSSDLFSSGLDIGQGPESDHSLDGDWG